MSRPLQERIIVFDALDTLMGYDGAEPGKSKPFYQDHLARQAGLSREEFLATVPYEEQLWRTYEAILAGDLEPVPQQGAIELLQYVHESGRTPVVMTADMPLPAAEACRPFTEAGLIEPAHIAAMHHIGPKSDSASWTRTKDIWFPKSRVDGVFEDGAGYVVAAAQGMDTQGYLVRFEDRGDTPPDVLAGTPLALRDMLRYHG